MTMTSLDQYRDRLAQLPEDRFIGSILWFSISGTVERADGKRSTVPVRVTHDQLEQWFEEFDLDKRFLPPRIAKVHAFRTACSEAVEKYALPTEGQTAELMVREVDFNPDFRIHHVIREVKDRRGKELAYEKVATLKFHRAPRTSKGKKSTGAEFYKSAVMHGVSQLDRDHIEALLQRFDARYNDLCTNLQAQAIRGMIRNYVTALNAIAVKPSGGVYFIHASRQNTLDGLQKLVQRIGQGSTLHQLPLIDTVEQREMLTDAFQDEVEDDVRLLLKDIAEANEKAKAAGKGAKISPTKYADFSSRYTAITERAEEYTRVLGLAQGRAGAALELALDSVMEMATRIDVKGTK